MLLSGSLQVLPAVTDNANLFVALTSVNAGLMNKTYSAQALQFNPNNNALTISANVYAGKLYTTSGLFWANGNAISTTYTTSTTPPGSPTVGDQWYDASTSTLFRYTYDGVSYFWLDISGASNPVTVSTSAATPPSNPNVGDFWYNTSTDVLSRYTNDGANSFWLDLTTPATVATNTNKSTMISFIFGS